MRNKERNRNTEPKKDKLIRKNDKHEKKERYREIKDSLKGRKHKVE
jgi:hypothetical protein